MFNYNPALAPALKRAGIGLVSTANNHILDRGPEGLDATMDVLTRAGIQFHGTIASQSQGSRPVYLPITLQRNGVSIKLAFLSFSWGTNGIPDPYGQVNLLWEGNDYGQNAPLRQSVLDAIAQAKREADVVIVAAHWGHEYHTYPEAGQVAAAAQMAAAGADIVLGAQPHTLQPTDVIDNNGRKTFVIYSLANFLASQGAFQASSYSATSVILYVGMVRQADGRVRVTGYRYLPTIHVDNDTRPAPIPAHGFEDVIAHVRLEMRDSEGSHQISDDPTSLGSHVEVCPRIAMSASASQVGGDFAHYLATLGSGTTPRTLQETLAVFGAPLGPVVQEPDGTCGPATAVLYTERQRLELHPEANWPARVVGSQVGTAVYAQRYGAQNMQRRLDLAGDAIANERFKTFFNAYGGLSVFGYPISGALNERDTETGKQRVVQYFERARFESVDNAPADSDLLAQVRLGMLGHEYPGIAVVCGTPVRDTLAQATQPTPSPVVVTPVPLPVDEPAFIEPWRVWALAVVGIALVAAIILWHSERRHNARYAARRAARRRRKRGTGDGR